MAARTAAHPSGARPAAPAAPHGPAEVPTRRLSALSPYQPEWVTRVVVPLAEDVRAGTLTAEAAADRLYHELHGWVVKLVARKGRHLPPTADRSELRSRIMEAALLACRTLDWNRTETFSQLLRVRVEGASVEAARHDDWLSRRHRKLLVHYRREVERAEQRAGRLLTPAEERELAGRLAPTSKRVAWVDELTRQCAPTAWNDIYENTITDHRATPEDKLVRDDRRRIVSEWLGSLPEDLRAEALEWAESSLDHHRGAPRPLQRRLRAHVPDLVARLGVDGN